MQLKIQRSQRMGGVTGTVVLFCLDVRAEYSPDERTNISKYRLGKQVIYNSQAARKHLDNMGVQLDRTQHGGTGERLAGLAKGVASFALAALHLNISIDSLGRGHHIECKDLNELMEAEEAVMEACRNLKAYLAVASTFNGSIVLIDFDQDEQQHISQGILELPSIAIDDAQSTAMVATSNPTAPFGNFDFAPYKPVGYAQRPSSASCAMVSSTSSPKKISPNKKFDFPMGRRQFEGSLRGIGRDRYF